jgi:sigma-B regulation protein RsbQ
MMKELFFEERGIYYRSNGFNPKRRTLFFVHGLSGSSAAWGEYERIFKKKYNVLSLDLRGHGKSVRRGEYKDYAIKEFSEDLAALLKHCGIKKCVLISHSFGALIALQFIADHENMLSAAVLISPHFTIGKMWSARLIKPFLMLAAKMKPEQASLKISGHVDYSEYVNTGDWNVRRTIADVTNTGLMIYLYSTAQTYDFDGEAILEKIKIPVLLIHGAKDSIFPLKYGRVMAEKIKNSKLVVINEGDHILVLNHGEKVVAAISDFLRIK